MNFDVPNAPSHAVPHTRWWLWAALALALHMGAGGLVWWLVQSPMQAIGSKSAADSEQANTLNVERLVWVDAGVQTTTPAAAARPQPSQAKPAKSAQPAAPVADVAQVQQPKPRAQPEPLQTTPSPSLAAKAAPEAAAGLTDNVTTQTTQSAASAVTAPRLAEQVVANSAPSVLQAYSPPPDYPALSQRMGEQGEVVLRVQVSAAGKALAVELAKPSGFERLDRAAMQTVSTWRFVPAMVDGQAQAAWFDVPVRFELR